MNRIRRTCSAGGRGWIRQDEKTRSLGGTVSSAHCLFPARSMLQAWRLVDRPRRTRQQQCNAGTRPDPRKPQSSTAKAATLAVPNNTPAPVPQLAHFGASMAPHFPSRISLAKVESPGRHRGLHPVEKWTSAAARDPSRRHHDRGFNAGLIPIVSLPWNEIALLQGFLRMQG